MNFQHIALHFLAPILLAFLFIPQQKRLKAALILLAANLVDLDHPLADPIYDPNRCSIGFHPLHSYLAICFYAQFLILPKTRLLAVGLLLHMLLDWIDCVF